MKTVVHIVNEAVQVDSIPDDWIKCSVLGEFRPPEEFRGDGKDHQSRTNCTRAYLMPMKEWEYHKEVQKKLASEIARQSDILYTEQQEKTAGISIDELIATLQQFRQQHPSARIVVCDEDGDLSTVSTPQRVDGFKNVFYI